jgi:hypothetical protein
VSVIANTGISRLSRDRACAGSEITGDKVIMKAKLTVIVFGAFVLVANGANAQPQTHAHHLSRIFGQARGYAPRETSQYVYGSYSRPANNNSNSDFQLGGER